MDSFVEDCPFLDWTDFFREIWTGVLPGKEIFFVDFPCAIPGLLFGDFSPLAFAAVAAASLPKNILAMSGTFLFLLDPLGAF